MNFSSHDYEKYKTHQSRCAFKTPEEECAWAETQSKICSKCKNNIKLTNFPFNTSGNDPFDKNGYRLRRPDCSFCVQSASKGIREARKKSKEMGLPIKPPKDAKCEICQTTEKLVYDHCHEKEEFRGWLCDACNRSLGVFGDNVSGLAKALNYLKKFEPDWKEKILF